MSLHQHIYFENDSWVVRGEGSAWGTQFADQISALSFAKSFASVKKCRVILHLENKTIVSADFSPTEAQECLRDCA